jgi:hypothetical protein
MTIGLDLDSMAAGVDSELLEHAIEFIDDAHEVAIHVDLRFARLDLQPERSGRALAIRARSGPVTAAVVSTAAHRAGIVAAVVVGVVPPEIIEAESERVARVVVVRVVVPVVRIARIVDEVAVPTAAVIPRRAIHSAAGDWSAVARSAVGRDRPA